MNKFSIVVEEIPQRCTQCGIIAVTRPYGLHHEEICYDCGILDESLTEIRMKENYFLGGDFDG